jgi:hypothetical protein
MGYLFDLSDNARLISASADTHPLPEKLETPFIPKKERCAYTNPD